MNTEYIKEETAKLAKEKKCDLYCDKVYGELDGYVGLHRMDNRNSFNNEKQFAAPSQTTLKRWLRETHKLHVGVNWDEDWWVGVFKLPGCKVDQSKWRNSNDLNGSTYFKKYEDAMETGLFEALKML